MGKTNASRKTENHSSNVGAQVDLQIKLLSRIRMESGIRRDLGNLPKTLETTYRQIYHDTILAAPGNEPEIAKKALGWIMVARRPLTSQEWICATEIATQDSLDFNSLLELCHNLVANDTESHVIRYIHLSAREYMEAHADFDFPRLHTMAAHACLSVLIDNAQPSSPKSESFTQYASKYWANHVERSDDNYMKENTLKLIRTFLGMPEEPSESYKKYTGYLKSKHYPNRIILDSAYGFTYHRAYDSLMAVPQNPLFAVSYFSLGRICTDLWDWSRVDVNCRNLHGDSALTVASRAGNDAMVRLVLDRCTDAVCDTLPWSDKPLVAAVRNHQSKVVTTLLSYRADIAAKICKSHDPLDYAAREGNVAVVQAVLSCKDLDICISASTLLAAAENRIYGESVLQFLLDSDKSLTLSQEVGTKVVEQIFQHWRLRDTETRLSLLQQFLDKGWELELSAPSIGLLISAGGNKALDWLLKHGTYSSMITGDVMTTVASCGPISDSPASLVALIERCPNLELLENALQHATVMDGALVNVILNRYPNLKPPESFLIPLARAGKSEGRLISILDKYPDMEISDEVLIAAARAGGSAFEKLLARDSSIKVSEDVLIAAARARGSAFENLLTRDRSIEISESVLEASAEYGPLSRVEMILEREPGLKPTDRILEAAARGMISFRRSDYEEFDDEESDYEEPDDEESDDEEPDDEEFDDEESDDEEPDDEEFDDEESDDEKKDAVKEMKLFLARNDELQISDQVLKAAMSNYDEELSYEKMKLLLSRPGVVISESVLLAAIRRGGSLKVVRLILASNFDANITTSEAVLVAAARKSNSPELLELLLNSATDAKVKVKENKTEAPVETQQEFQSLLPKDRKVYITEKVLVAAAERGLYPIKYLLGYDPEIRITGSIADAIMSNWHLGPKMRPLLLSEFKENLTQEAVEKLEKPKARRDLRMLQ